MKITTFIDKAILEYLCELIENEQVSNSEDLELKTRIAYFFKEQTLIYTNMSNEELENLTRETPLGRLRNKYSIRANEDQTVFNLILTNEQYDGDCYALGKKKGVIHLNINLLKQKHYLLFATFDIYSVTKNKNASYQLSNWSVLKNINLFPWNAMIIIDPHIFIDKRSENVVEILKRFNPIPQAVVTIIAQRNNGAESDFQDRYKEIKTMFPNIILEFVITHQHKIHDRNIITNNLWLHSGNCFNYFQGKTTKANSPTQLMVFPIFHQNNRLSQNNERGYQVGAAVSEITDNAKCCLSFCFYASNDGGTNQSSLSTQNPLLQ